MGANKFSEEGRERVKFTIGKLGSKRKHVVAAYDPMKIKIFRNEIENLWVRCNAAFINISNNAMMEKSRTCNFWSFDHAKVSIMLICKKYFQLLLCPSSDFW